MFRKSILLFSLLCIGTPLWAVVDEAQMSVWVNDAIVSTYTYTYQNITARQKVMGHFFTTEGWMGYLKELNASHLIDDVKKNQYEVTAVATLPPEIKNIGGAQFSAKMPLLVSYKNPKYQQKQVLEVTVNFIEVPPSPTKPLGLALTRLVSKETEPPCDCQPTNAQK